MKTSILVLSSLLLLSQSAFASKTIERKLFTLEKSLNSENILNIHTQTNENCKFVTNSNGYIDFYWLMNGKTKKDVHPTIKSKVKERVKFISINQTNDSFTVRLNDLSEIKHDLESNIIEIQAKTINGNCTVNSIIPLGASAKYKKLNLERTYCEVKSVLGVPNGCKYIELSGKENTTNEILKVKFIGK